MLLLILIFLIMTFSCIASFSSLGIFKIVLEYILTVFALFSVYIVFVLLKEWRIRRVLDEECDPQKFLALIEKYMASLRKRQEKKKYKKGLERALTINEINRAVAYMVMEDYKTAIDILNEVDTSLLSEKSGSYYIYILDKICCLYELGEIEEAEKLYSTELVRLSPLNKRMRKSAEILIGDRYYYLGKYEESYEYLKKLLTAELSKRAYLGVLFRLAKLELMKDEKEQAIKKYQKVVKFGNKLGIVQAAKDALMKLEEN